MISVELQQFLMPLLSAAGAAVGAWGALRVKLEWHDAEIRRAHARIDVHDRRAFGETIGGRPL